MTKIKWTKGKEKAIKDWLEMFVSKHDVTCGEDVLQRDTVSLDALDFTAELIDLVEPEES